MSTLRDDVDLVRIICRTSQARELRRAKADLSEYAALVDILRALLNIDLNPSNQPA
jgi:hypothetical protein